MFLLQFFEYLGFNLNNFDYSNPILFVFVAILFLSSVCLLGVFNIALYLLSIYVIDNKLEFISKYFIKYPILKKIIYLYRASRIGLIVSEVFIILLCLFYIMSICYKIIIRLN